MNAEAIIQRDASTVAGLAKLLRPKQWVKNGFVLAPLLFAEKFTDLDSIVASVQAMILFCVAASATYIVNDYRDIEHDRKHPVKRHTRPLASGQVGRSQALMVLAQSKSTDEKTVSLKFLGKGDRQVRVGYIQESPIWKTSYRLVLKDEDKPFLQGWAIVENTTEDDWKDVRLTLVSGRPISFVMDLYEPLYVSRPVVEPELFASLRPQTYGQDLAGADADFVRKASEFKRRAMPGAPPAPHSPCAPHLPPERQAHRRRRAVRTE